MRGSNHFFLLEEKKKLINNFNEKATKDARPFLLPFNLLFIPDFFLCLFLYSQEPGRYTYSSLHRSKWDGFRTEGLPISGMK